MLVSAHISFWNDAYFNVQCAPAVYVIILCLDTVSDLGPAVNSLQRSASDPGLKVSLADAPLFRATKTSLIRVPTKILQPLNEKSRDRNY
jgi:hypothetical protein